MNQKIKTTHIVMMEDLNPYGSLFGGKIMSWMDQIALILSVKHTKCNCVTAKFSEINFKEKISLKDMVEFEAEIIEEKTTSLVIKITAKKLCFECVDSVFVADATAVFVAIDENGKPIEYKNKKISCALK